MVSDRLPILYSFRRCPYAMRARLGLAISGQACELREVVLRNKPQALIDASPKATVPVLVLPDNTVIDESLDILLWALHRNDPENWLQPDSGSLNDMLALIADNDGPFKQQLDRYKYPNRFDLDDGVAHRDEGAQWLQELDQRLATTRWLFGDQRALADMAIAPFVRQYAHTDRDWFYAQPWEHLSAWLKRFLEDGLFTAIMEKYKPWEPGQGAPVFGLHA